MKVLFKSDDGPDFIWDGMLWNGDADATILAALNAQVLPRVGLSQGVLNRERAFAESLDAAPAAVVRWWHRNEVKRPWSVSLVLPGGGRFFPDFIISIDGRKRDDGILLADPKAMWEQSDQHGKVLTEHPSYGKALIITKAGLYGWHPIVWDAKTQKPALGGAWAWDQAAGW